MRIQDSRGPNRLGGKNLRKTDGAAGSGFAAHLDTREETTEATALGGVGALDGALLLQEAGDPLDERQESHRHGGRLLAHLDQLRMDLLCGAVSVGQLQQLQRTLDRERPAVVPPEMQDVLAEIELRVRVELAKFGH
jgi:hypothetical protein